MVERRSGLGFLEEPLAVFLAECQVRGEKLESYEAFKFGVESPVNNAHPTDTCETKNLVVGDTVASCEGSSGIFHSR